MDKLFGDLKNFFKAPKCTIDNFVFRLHYKYSLAILIAFSIAVTGSQFIGNPIDCISKDDIPETLLKTFCWISTTFSVRSAWKKEVGKEVPYPGVDKYTPGEDRVYHAYYQWVCFVLFLQGLSFYIPRYLWKNTEGHKIMDLRMDFNKPIVSAKTEPKTDILVDYLMENRGHHMFYGTMYVFCEALNFLNVVSQICIMDVFLGGEFSTYGIKVLAFTEWDYALRYDPMIEVFPRMTKCTFYRYGSSGDVQKHDAMCLIPINILNEKIYIFLWFWFMMLAVLTGVALIYRLAVSLVPALRYRILQSKCRRVNPDALRTVLRCSDRNDWFVLSLLCKNMRSDNFNWVIQKFSEQLKEQCSKRM